MSTFLSQRSREQFTLVFLETHHHSCSDLMDISRDDSGKLLEVTRRKHMHRLPWHMRVISLAEWLYLHSVGRP